MIRVTVHMASKKKDLKVRRVRQEQRQQWLDLTDKSAAVGVGVAESRLVWKMREVSEAILPCFMTVMAHPPSF